MIEVGYINSLTNKLKLTLKLKDATHVEQTWKRGNRPKTNSNKQTSPIYKEILTEH